MILQDKYKRTISYMRVSVTDRCNLHCSYCRPQGGKVAEAGELLTLDETLLLCRVAAGLGIRVFKITGGEPLLRDGCVDFMAQLKKLDGVHEVTLTTNGTLLEQYLPDLAAAGIKYINLSLDTLDKDHYRALTGGDLDKVVGAIPNALACGMKLKINCVPLQLFSPEEYCQLVKLTELGIPVRFIELMPLECNGALKGYSAAEILQILQDGGYSLQPLSDGQHFGFGPAKYYSVQGFSAPIGFIEPLHGKFCAQCNRVRLTAMGQFKTCLYSNEMLDLRSMLRNGASLEALQQAIIEEIAAKPKEHQFCVKAAGFAMSNIGG